MIEVIKKCPIKNFEIGNSTKNYMKMVGMDTVPEDVYFSKNLQKLKSCAKRYHLMQSDAA